jgi:hypothetical protein
LLRSFLIHVFAACRWELDFTAAAA